MAVIKIRGNNHYYRDLNDHHKDVIVLVHGHPFNNTMWEDQVNTLHDHRLILPDLKGYGKTDYQFDKIYIEEQALDLAILLDMLDIAQVHLIGLSMGGQIVIEFSRLFPHRTKSLIICGCNPSAETQVGYQDRLQLAEKINSIGMMEYTDQEIHKYLSKNTIQNNKRVYDHLYKMMCTTSTTGAVASHKGRAERRDNYDHLKHITCPSCIIVGGEDFFTPVGEMQDIANQIHDSQFEIIPNAGHMPNMEQPEIFNAIVKRFYDAANND